MGRNLPEIILLVGTGNHWQHHNHRGSKKTHWWFSLKKQKNKRKDSTLRKPLILLLIPIFLATSIFPAFARDWTEFGGSPERMRATDQPMGMPVMPIWGELNVGMSSSQPIVVNNTIYLLAGDAVWALDGSKPPGTPPDELVIAKDERETGCQLAKIIALVKQILV